MKAIYVSTILSRKFGWSTHAQEVWAAMGNEKGEGRKKVLIIRPKKASSSPWGHDHRNEKESSSVSVH